MQEDGFAIRAAQNLQNPPAVAGGAVDCFPSSAEGATFPQASGVSTGWTNEKPRSPIGAALLEEDGRVDSKREHADGAMNQMRDYVPSIRGISRIEIGRLSASIGW